MTARVIIVPGAQPSRDANGRALPAKLRFYAPGTTTPKSVYTADDLATPHAFPILSDSAGRWPAIWADDAQSFDVAWSDQTFDAVIATYSNLSPADDAVLASVALAEAAEDGAVAAQTAAETAQTAAEAAQTAAEAVQTALEPLSSAVSDAQAAATSATADAEQTASDRAAVTAMSHWVTKTGAYTLAPFDQIAADSSGGAFNLTLPASPADGDRVAITDPNATWGTHAVSLLRNGKKIFGVADDLSLNAPGATFGLAYSASAGNWSFV